MSIDAIITSRRFRVGDVIHLPEETWEIARFGRDSFLGVPNDYHGAIAVAQSHQSEPNARWPFGNRSLSPYGPDILKYDQQKGLHNDELMSYMGRFNIPLSAHFVVTHPGPNMWNRQPAIPESIPSHSYFPRDEDGLEQENWRHLPFQASLCEPDGKLIDSVRILFDVATKDNPKGISTERIIGRSKYLTPYRG